MAAEPLGGFGVLEVFFSGLILICFDGMPNKCPTDNQSGFPNTGWVVNANGLSRTCGRGSQEQTQLVLEFRKEWFRLQTLASCSDFTESDGTIWTRCPVVQPRLCVDPVGSITPTSETHLDWLPSIHEIDPRYGKLLRSQLESPRVTTRISFKDGLRTTEGRWKEPTNKIDWYRTDNTLFRRNGLARSLIMAYDPLTELRITNCSGQDVFELAPTGVFNKREVHFKNVAVNLPMANISGDWSRLHYLFWYYELARWKTADGQCPAYDAALDPAVVLQCRTPFGLEECFWDIAGSSVYWPAMLGPRM